LVSRLDARSVGALLVSSPAAQFYGTNSCSDTSPGALPGNFVKTNDTSLQGKSDAKGSGMNLTYERAAQKKEELKS
jgi:hypothetical protein